MTRPDQRGFRQKCLTSEPVHGIFVAIPHPVAVEVSAAAGVDFLCLDGEHAQIGRAEFENLIRAADVHGVPAIVRVPGHLPDSIASVLDAGASGVLVPRVSSADQARAAVQATRYPPTGARGVGPGRAAGYGYGIPDYLASANERIVLAIQAETAESLQHIEDICAVDGVDVIFIGPGDLAVSLGAMGPAGRPKLDAAIARITSVARAAGRAVGIFCAAPSEVPQWRSLGISFFLIGNDTRHLGGAVGALMTTARQG